VLVEALPYSDFKTRDRWGEVDEVLRRVYKEAGRVSEKIFRIRETKQKQKIDFKPASAFCSYVPIIAPIIL